MRNYRFRETRSATRKQRSESFSITINAVPIARDFGWTSGKPIFFPWFSTPFVRRSESTSAWWPRRSWDGAVHMADVAHHSASHRACWLDPSIAPLALVLAGAIRSCSISSGQRNPDALVAALVLTPCCFTDTIATEPQRDTRWHIVALAAGDLIQIQMNGSHPNAL